jgi:hypothetical protein
MVTEEKVVYAVTGGGLTRENPTQKNVVSFVESKSKTSKTSCNQMDYRALVEAIEDQAHNMP